jgi:fucose 4-O-acetylase-like acetyltransferase
MTDAVATTPAPVRKSRVPFWDNARFACITLVVVGHAIERLTSDSDYAYTLYIFIYAFHMPAFAMISGYFSKASPPTTRQMKKVLTDIVLPYVIMQTIWTVVQFLVEGSTSLNPTTPHWTLWFLLALGIFRVVLPYLVLLRQPLLWAIIASVGVGYLANVDSTFSLSRAIGILPFFLLGWKVRQWGIVDRWRLVEAQTWWIRASAIAVLVVWLGVAFLFSDTWRSFGLGSWFFYDDSYSGLGETQWWAGLVRLAIIALGILLCAAFFVLIPRRKSWMTTFGQSTMYVYLLHSFLLYPIRQSGFLKDEHASWPYLLAMIAIAVLISIALSTPIVRRVFHWVIEPKPAWLFIETTDDAKTSRRDPTGSRRDAIAERDRPLRGRRDADASR